MAEKNSEVVKHQTQEFYRIRVNGFYIVEANGGIYNMYPDQRNFSTKEDKAITAAVKLGGTLEKVTLTEIITKKVETMFVQEIKR